MSPLLFVWISGILGQEWTPLWQNGTLSPLFPANTWVAAREICASISNGCKGSLPLPRNEIEMKSLPNLSHIGVYRPFFFGESPIPPIDLTDGWFYLDQSPFPVNLWSPRNPRGTPNGHIALTDGLAIDQITTYSTEFVCQIDPCSDDWEPLANKEYKLFHMARSWASARSFCQDRSPDLESDLAVPSSNLARELMKSMPFSLFAWMGVYRDLTSETWTSVDGSLPANETIQMDILKNCAGIFKDASLAARDCSFTQFFICQRTRCFPGSSTETSTCANCSSGTFSTKFNEKSCTSCDPGFYQDASGQTFCRQCPQGRYSLQGFSACLGCLQGRYQPSSGQSFCLDCPLGYSSLPGSLECSLCPVGFIPNGTEGCSSCRQQGTTTQIGSIACVCKEGSLGEYPNCIQCPAQTNVRCPIGSIFPELGSGLWIDPENPLSITNCVPQEACLKTVGNMTTCAPGYGDLYCSQCLEGFYRSGSSCQKCGQSALGILLFLVVLLLIFILSFRFLQSDGTLPVEWKICLNWVQILSFLPELSLNWPSNLNTLFKISSFSNLNVDLFSPECSVSISFSQGFHLKSNLLWIFTGILVLAISIQQAMTKTRLKIFVQITSMNITLCKLFNAIVVVYASLFTYTILNVFSPARCSRQLDGRSLMTSNLLVQCGSREWEPLLVGMVLYSILYLVIFPIVITGLFWKFRNQIGTPEEQMLIGGLTRSYKKEFFWWEIINVAKKTGLTLLLSLPASSRNQMFFASLVLFMSLEIMLKPFKLEVQSQLNTLWSLLTLLILGAGFSIDGPEDLDSLSVKIFTSLVIVVFCLVFAFSLRSMASFFLHKVLNRTTGEKIAPSEGPADQVIGITNAEAGNHELADTNPIKILPLGEASQTAHQY